MEQRYRGYPLPLDWKHERADIGNTEANRRRILTEWDYFRGLYPLEAKRLQRVVEAEFDRIDRIPGPMYDEYPDREFLYQVRDLMFARAIAEGIAAERDLIQVLMLQELLNRRRKLE